MPIDFRKAFWALAAASFVAGCLGGCLVLLWAWWLAR